MVEGKQKQNRSATYSVPVDYRRKKWLWLAEAVSLHLISPLKSQAIVTLGLLCYSIYLRQCGSLELLYRAAFSTTTFREHSAL